METSRRLGEQQCRQFQLWLNDKLSPFAVPILIAHNKEIKPRGMANGSGCLIQADGWVGVLTCFHVWKHLTDIGDKGTMVIVLGNGFRAVHVKKPTLRVSDQEADIAIIDLTGIGGLTQKAWFPLKRGNVYVPKKRDILVVLGFPGIWRKSVKNRSDFKFGALPFVVEDVSTRSIVIAGQGNKEVFDYFGSQPLRKGMNNVFGGLSGAPAFFITPNQKIKMAGHVTGTTHGALLLTRSSLVLALLGRAEPLG